MVNHLIFCRGEAFYFVAVWHPVFSFCLASCILLLFGIQFSVMVWHPGTRFLLFFGIIFYFVLWYYFFCCGLVFSFLLLFGIRLSVVVRCGFLSHIKKNTYRKSEMNGWVFEITLEHGVLIWTEVKNAMHSRKNVNFSCIIFSPIFNEKCIWKKSQVIKAFHLISYPDYPWSVKYCVSGWFCKDFFSSSCLEMSRQKSAL